MPLLDEGLRRRGKPEFDPDEALLQRLKRRRFNLSKKFERRDATRQFQSVYKSGDLRRRIAQALARKKELEARETARQREEAMGKFRAAEQAMQPLGTADERRRTAASSWFRPPDDEEAKARRERITELRIATQERRMAEASKRYHDVHKAGEAAPPMPTPAPTPEAVPLPAPVPAISATPAPDDKDKREDDERYVEGFGGPPVGPQPQSWNKLTGEITDKVSGQVIGNRQPSGTIQRFEEILDEELTASVAQFGGGYPASGTGPYEAAEERAMERWKTETSEWGAETFIHQQGKLGEADLVTKMRSASPFDLRDSGGYAGIIRDELRGRRSDEWEPPKAGTLEDGKLLGEYKRNLEEELTTQLVEEYGYPAEAAPAEAYHLVSAGLAKMRVALAQDPDNPVKDRHEQNIAIALAMRAAEIQDLMLNEMGWTDKMRVEQEVPEHIQNLVLAKINDELGTYLPLGEAPEMRGGFLGWKSVAGRLLGTAVKLMNTDFIPVYPSAKLLETTGLVDYGEKGPPKWGSLTDAFEGGAYFSRPVAERMLKGIGGAAWGGEWAFEAMTGIDTEHKVSGAIQGKVANMILTEVINPAGLVIVLPFVGPAIRGTRGASLVARLTSVMFMTGLEPKYIPATLRALTAVGKGGIKGMINIPAAVKASPQAMRMLDTAVRNYHATHFAGEMGRLRGGLLSKSGEATLRNWRNKGVVPTIADLRKTLRENGIPYTRTSTKDDMLAALAAEKMKISEPVAKVAGEAFTETESRELAVLEAKTVLAPEEGARLDALRGRAFQAAAGAAKEPDFITAYHGYSSAAPKVADDGTLATELHYAGDRGVAEEYAHRAAAVNGGEPRIYEVRIPRSDFVKRGNVYFGSKSRLAPVAEHGVAADAVGRAAERASVRAGQASIVTTPELAKMIRGAEAGPLRVVEEATERLIDNAVSYNPGSVVDAHAASLLGEIERGTGYTRLFRAVTMSADDLVETLSKFRIGEETTLGAVGFSRSLKKAHTAAGTLAAAQGVDRPRRVVFTAERVRGFDLTKAGAKAAAGDPADAMVAGKFVVSEVSTKGNVTRIALRPSSQRFPVSRMHELRITESAELDPGLEAFLSGEREFPKAVLRQMAEQELGERLPRGWTRAKIASRLKEEKASRMIEALAKETDESLMAEAAGGAGRGGEPPSGIESPANPNPRGPKPGQFPRQITDLTEVIADVERSAKSYMGSITRAVGKQPILRGIIDNVNPSALADGRFEYTLIGFARKKQAVMLYSELHNFVMGERESRLGFNFVNNVSQAKDIVKPQFGMLPTPEAIVVFPERFNLSKKQLEFVDEVRGFLNEQSAFERARDVPLKVLYDDTASVRQYFHNDVIEAPSEAAKAEVVRRGTAKIGGVKDYMKQRVFKEMQDGIENGYKYGDTITANVMARYRSGQVAALDQELLQLAAREKSISTEAIQASMAETLKATEQAPLRFIEWFNNIARPMVTGADLGFLGLQVVPGFARNPVAAVKGMHYMMDALVTDSRLMAGYWRNHIKQGWVARYLSGGGSLNQTETSFEFAGRTGIEGALFHAGPMGRFTNSFSSTLNVIAMENFKGMVGVNDFLFRTLGKKRATAVITRAFGGPAHWFKGFEADTVDSAAAAVSSKLTMRFNSALLNIPKRQAQLERALAFAPGYYRAFFGLLSDAIQGGMRGAESRRVLGQMAAGFFAGNYLLEKATGMELITNPFDPNFMTVPIAGLHAGVGGPFVSLLRAIAKVASVPESKEGLWGVKGPEVFEGRHIGLNPNLTKWKFWDKDINTNPILRWGRGKLSPAASLIMDVIQGETFVYEPVHTPRQFLENTLQRMTPFFVQAGREAYAGGGTKDALIAGSLEFFSGARTWPLRPSEKFEAAWDEKYGEEYGKLNKEDPLHRDLIKKDEDLAALDEQVSQDSAKFFGDEGTVMTEDILRREQDALGDTADRILAGQADAYSNWGMNRKLALNSIADRRSDENTEWGDPDSEIGKLVQEYYDIRPEQFPSDDAYAGYVDWDAYEAAREAVLARMDPERAALIRDRDRFKTPEIEAIDKRWRQYQDDRDVLEETVPVYRFLDRKEDELAVDELMATVATVRDLISLTGESVGRPKILEVLLQAVLADPEAYPVDWKVIAVAWLLSKDTTRDLALSDERDEFIIAHPDMALFSKGFWDGLSREEQLEWIERNPGKPHRLIKSIWED